MTRMLALVGAVFFLSACTSLVEKGDKLYEQGMYQQAAEFYQQALNEDATDVEAQQRLNQARHKIIDRGLIEVRMLRLAANQVGAADKLEAILRNQSAWHIEAMGAQAATQSEEIRYAEQFLRTQAKDLASSTYPDKFRWFEHKYAFLVANAQLTSLLTGYQQQLSEQATNKCHTLAEQVQGQRFFLKQLAQKYCSAWGVSPTFKLDQRDQSRYRSIVFNKQLQLNTSKRRAHQQLIDGALRELKDQFQQSIWYSPFGDNVLNLTITADVDYQRNSIQKQQEKRYLVKELRLDPNDKSKQVEVDIERVYIYPQTHYYEEYSARLSYSGQLATMQFANQYIDSKNNRTVSHSADFEEAELTPRTAKFLDQTGAFSDYLKHLTQGTSEELTKLWANQYCQNQYAQNSTENVLRCARVAPDDDYVNSWFERQFGIDYKAMRTLYGA
ncbi:tetratricopeptide repeat protein [Pseudoalteromonas sp. MMG022]|uniref:tetratricopeptide repeat protein n=1 Tax=Pseudoalteromonas sp. MMG022 TaxID=2909978 RepID=UPI001F47AEDE|nr:tetratricopeptide repeat protein [Pseudoalteromonas sp. MMG022]MCF6436413.1 tetratricopeptide repeat protein [Pseudoalteromonas sp. MMG022]